MKQIASRIIGSHYFEIPKQRLFFTISEMLTICQTKE